MRPPPRISRIEPWLQQAHNRVSSAAMERRGVAGTTFNEVVLVSTLHQHHQLDEVVPSEIPLHSLKGLRNVDETRALAVNDLDNFVLAPHHKAESQSGERPPSTRGQASLAEVRSLNQDSSVKNHPQAQGPQRAKIHNNRELQFQRVWCFAPRSSSRGPWTVRGAPLWSVNLAEPRHLPIGVACLCSVFKSVGKVRGRRPMVRQNSRRLKDESVFRDNIWSPPCRRHA